MKYYLIEIATGDLKIQGKAIYEYNTKDEAIANFHSRLGTAMKSELYTSVLEKVIDSMGNEFETAYYSRPVESEE